MLNWRIESFSGGRHVCQRFSTLLRVAAACVFFGSVRSGAAAPSVEEIAAGVEAQFNKLRTSRLYCEYRWESKPIKPGQEVAFPWKEIVFAMENNRKFYLKHRAPHDQPSGVARIIVQESAFDGAAATNLTGVMGYVLKEPKGVYWLDMYLQQVTVHTLGSSEGVLLAARLASSVLVRNAKAFRACCRQVSTTVRIVSTKRLPAALCVPKESFRQMTA